MKRITLKPLDDGQKAVDIPVGKTTIGRGSFLGCTDKKVSRNHAVLEVTSKGEVFLTPTHVNPCFYQPTADSPGQILKKDIPHKLENGDSFSLLPRAFRYQLIVGGDSTVEKNADQSDLNKQCGKTNGAAVDDCESVLNERNKDPVKCNNTEDLNSDATVTEKAFVKDDELINSSDKSYSKEENTFSKKITDITNENKKTFFNEDKKVNEESSDNEKSPSKENSSLEGDVSANEKNISIEDSHDEKEDSCEDEPKSETKNETQNNKLDSPKGNESLSEDKNVSEEKPKSFNDKVIEENESTLGNDTFPKEKAEVEESQAELDKKDSKNAQDDSESKEVENSGESNGAGNLDHDSSKETEDGNDAKSRELPDWIVTDNMPPPTKGARRKNTQAAKQSQKEKPAPKRKTAADTSEPKPKGRRKTQRLDFDDGGEGNSQRPGRTSSRTNRQTRQGLSLEDFIVSDDDEWQSDRSEPKQRRRKRGSRRGDDSGSDWEIEHKKTKKPLHKIGSGSESGSDWGIQKKKKGPKGRRRKTKQSSSEVASEEEVDEEAEPSSESSNKDKKIPCVYGKKCYRRNQNHIDQFSHPGDSDNASEPETTSKSEEKTNEKNNEKKDENSESEDESNKKECPYGANCFRKNPQHKKDFKHTKKVRPQREAAKQADKKTKSSRNSAEVDSYDLNDSFLNDDSDEYKPVDSGSDYESGKIKRFTKGKAAKNKRGRKV